MRVYKLAALLIVMAMFLGLGWSIRPVPVEAQVLELDAIVVEGRIQRPQASYIIQRASIDFGIQAKRKSFVDQIVQSIEGKPF
jgi:hypothetical protein